MTKEEIPLPENVRDLSNRIAFWRENKKPSEAMPKELWKEAASFANQYGIHLISQALTVNYYSLKRHAKLQLNNEFFNPKNTDERIHTSSIDFPVCENDFVDISKICLEEDSSTVVTEVVVSRTDGSKLTVRQNHGGIDVVGLVRAFSQANI